MKQVARAVWSCRDVRGVLGADARDYKRGGVWSVGRLLWLFVASYVCAGMTIEFAEIPEYAISTGYRHGLHIYFNVGDVFIWPSYALTDASSLALTALIGGWWLAVFFTMRARGDEFRKIVATVMAGMVMMPIVMAVPMLLVTMVVSLRAFVVVPWVSTIELVIGYGATFTGLVWISWWGLGCLRPGAKIRRVIYALLIGLTGAWTLYSVYGI
ncbi:MAG TPA: hypothetical protein VK176_15750 [Phycisphaerales bacterium]|nr:hypothetical protein [Phycisphaerales bacterium]